MRIGLFGKILLAFWLVLLLMSQGIWLLYAQARDFKSSEERTAGRVAPPLLTLLAQRIQTSGAEEAQRELLLLPPAFRDNIAIRPASTQANVTEDDRLQITRRAVAPTGSEFVLVYTAPGKGRGPLDIPRDILLVAAAAGLLFSAALAWYLSRPLLLLREAFKRVADGELDVQLRQKLGGRADEIADLARDFDSMTARLAQLITARDRLLHDVSHELRSPLTRLQQAIELARQDPRRTEELMDRMEHEVRKLDSMVHELLALARAESGAQDGNEYFDPVTVVQSVVSDAEFEAQMRGSHVRLAVPPLDEDSRPSIRGSAELVGRAIENVVRNALRFSPPNGTVHVGVELRQAPPRYRFVITDEGPGVDTQTPAKLFDPFVRADTAGIGLGLAIAKRAIVSHGGEIAARNGEEGGFIVEIDLPAVQHDVGSSPAPSPASKPIGTVRVL